MEEVKAWRLPLILAALARCVAVVPFSSRRLLSMKLLPPIKVVTFNVREVQAMLETPLATLKEIGGIKASHKVQVSHKTNPRRWATFKVSRQDFNQVIATAEVLTSLWVLSGLSNTTDSLS